MAEEKQVVKESTSVMHLDEDFLLDLMRYLKIQLARCWVEYYASNRSSLQFAIVFSRTCYVYFTIDLDRSGISVKMEDSILGKKINISDDPNYKEKIVEYINTAIKPIEERQHKVSRAISVFAFIIAGGFVLYIGILGIRCLFEFLSLCGIL